MKTIIYKCDSVWNVRSGCSQDTLDRIASNGFSGFDAVTLSINGSWITEFGYEAYLSLDKDYVYIFLGPSNSPDIPLFTYTWSGEFVSGEMPLDQFLIKEGLV